MFDAATSLQTMALARHLPLSTAVLERSIEHMFDHLEPSDQSSTAPGAVAGACGLGADLIADLAAFEQQRVTLARALGAFEQSGLWAADGMLTMTAWLQHHARMTHRDALAWVREGRFMHRYTAVAEAAEAGSLSASQVATIRAAVSKPTADLFDEHQQAVVDAIDGLDAAATETVCADWRDKAEATVDMPEPKVPDRTWTMSKLGDGTGVGRFVFDPATTNELETALGTARSWDGPGDDRDHRTRNADAMADIFGFFNANHDRNGTPRHRPHVELHLEATSMGRAGEPVDLHALADDDTFGWTLLTSDRQVLPKWAKEKYECDCVIHRVLRAGSAVLDYGRADAHACRSRCSAPSPPAMAVAVPPAAVARSPGAMPTTSSGGEGSGKRNSTICSCSAAGITASSTSSAGPSSCSPTATSGSPCPAATSSPPNPAAGHPTSSRREVWWARAVALRPERWQSGQMRAP